MDSDTLRWILLACFVLGCIFFLVITILGYKSWRVLHILSAIFMFACAATFAVYFALLTKATLAWKEIDTKNRVTADKAEEDLRQYVYGDIGPEYSEDSVVGVQGALARQLLGRGRVWRSAIGQLQGGNLVVNLAAPVAEEGEVAPPAPTIEVDSPLFVFTEQVTPESGTVAAPQRYLGEFSVNAANGSALTLEPTLVFYRPEEFTGAVQLVLYEKMPGDQHSLLADLRAQSASPSEFRATLTQQIFPPQFFGLLPEQVDPNSPTVNAEMAARYERLIDEYQFDGLGLNEIGDAIAQMTSPTGGNMARVRPSFDPKPEEIWVTVEMLQDFKVQVDAENPGGDDDIRRLAVSRQYYDTRGLAISADLRLEREVELKKGDQIEIDSITALVGYDAAEEGGQPYASWKEQGLIGDPVKQTYRRPLNDYQLALQELNLAQARITQDIAWLEGEIIKNQDTITASDRLLVVETNEQERLRLDLESLLEDVRVVTAYQTELEALLSARRQRINALFVETQALAARKAELEAEMVRRIDQATSEAVTAQ